MTIRETEKLYSLTQVAEITGLKYSTLLVYRARHQLPPADMVIARSPFWTLETIAVWDKQRGRLGQYGRGRRKNVQ